MSRDSVPNIVVRPVTAADFPAIYGLVCELAEYERAPQEVITTPEQYLHDWSEGLFEAALATADDTPVGMVLFHFAYSTWKGKMLYIEDLIVTANYRRYGIGQRLFDYCIEHAHRTACRLVKWQVLDWNEPAIQFYRRQGATIETDWLNGKLFLSAQPPNM